MLTVDAFDHIVLNVGDVETSAQWYEQVLGMTRQTRVPNHGGAARTRMMFGRHKINLRPVGATQQQWLSGRAPQAGSDDLCFLTGMTPDQVVEHFRRCGVAIVLGPAIKQGARGDIRSVYVRDPDGNLIEVASYA